MGNAATVSGPITGGEKGWPFGCPVADLAQDGYVVEEFFLDGEATRYRPVAGMEFGREGRWQAEPAGTDHFRTRLLVYRPADTEHFNGTVIVSWNNVTAGYELFAGDTREIIGGGYAFVGVTTQRVGVHGLPPTPQGLADWDPGRYGSLSITSDDYSYDIFTQAARAVRPDRDRTVDPLGGLDVRTVIAMGASQSAGRLGTYVNAIQPLSRAFDGFILTIYFGTGTPLEVGDTVVNINDPQRPPARVALRGSNLLRDDLDVPVMVVNSELEASACYAVRQPDTDRFRYWEAAGTSHVSAQSLAARADKYEREFGVRPPAVDGRNEVPMIPVFDAAIHHMHGWANGGPPPPPQPLITFEGEPPEVVRDDLGLAKGGIRLPQVEVPLARHSAIPLGPDVYSYLYGSTVAFSPETVESLYPDEAGYLARFEEATRAAEKAGVILPADVEPLVQEAKAAYRNARG